jgi:hypothetical protein
MMIHTKCDACVFAELGDNKIQTGCKLDRELKLGVNETNDDGFFNLSRFCNTYRPKEWLPMLSLEESENLCDTVLQEVRPRVGFFVIMDSEGVEAIDKLKKTLLDIKNQKNAIPRYVVVVNDKVEYNNEIQGLFGELFDHYITMHHIVQINTTFPTEHHLIDEAFIHAKNGWVYVTSSGENVPLDLLEKMHQRMNVNMDILSVVKPYDDINGMIFQTSLFKYLNGNRRKVYEGEDGEKNVDDRPFLEKVEDLAQMSAEGSVIEWGEFYGD